MSSASKAVLISVFLCVMVLFEVSVAMIVFERPFYQIGAINTLQDMEQARMSVSVFPLEVICKVKDADRHLLLLRWNRFSREVPCTQEVWDALTDADILIRANKV